MNVCMSDNYHGDAIADIDLRLGTAFLHSNVLEHDASNALFHLNRALTGYTGAVKPPVRRTGNRKSGPEETGIYAAEPPSRRNSFPGWGRQLIGYIIRSVPDPVRIPLSWSGSWQDRSERC